VRRRAGETPANIKAFGRTKVREIAKAGPPDAGNLDPHRLTPARWTSGLLAKYGKATPEALVGIGTVGGVPCSRSTASSFRDFKISVKHNDPVVMVRAYEQAGRAVRLSAATSA